MCSSPSSNSVISQQHYKMTYFIFTFTLSWRAKPWCFIEDTRIVAWSFLKLMHSLRDCGWKWEEETAGITSLLSYQLEKCSLSHLFPMFPRWQQAISSPGSFCLGTNWEPAKSHWPKTTSNLPTSSAEHSRTTHILFTSSFKEFYLSAQVVRFLRLVFWQEA